MRLPVKLVRVIDGDTAQVICRGLKETIRFHSVDTEESAIGYGKPATPAGIRAKHYTREMLASGTEIELSLDDFTLNDEAIATARDKYNRLLGHVYIDGLHLNHELIRLGFSPYFNKYGGSRLYDSGFRAAQAEAQHQGLMIWGDANAGGASRNYDKLLPWWERRAAAVDLARYSTVNGRESHDSTVNDRDRVYICDNECHLIAQKSNKRRNFFEPPLIFRFLADFQLDITKKFSKGWVLQQKSKDFLIRFFFANNFLQSGNNLQLISQLTQEKDYGFLSGHFTNYRGTMQVNVSAIAFSPFDL